jgi:hypothetical protein
LDDATNQRAFSLLARQVETLNQESPSLSVLTPSQVHYLLMQCERFMLVATKLRSQMLYDAGPPKIG